MHACMHACMHQRTCHDSCASARMIRTPTWSCVKHTQIHTFAHVHSYQDLAICQQMLQTVSDFEMNEQYEQICGVWPQLRVPHQCCPASPILIEWPCVFYVYKYIYIYIYIYMHTYIHAASCQSANLSWNKRNVPRRTVVAFVWLICTWMIGGGQRKLKGGKAPESQPMVLRGTFDCVDLLPVLRSKKGSFLTTTVLPFLRASFAAMIHCDTQHFTAIRHTRAVRASPLQLDSMAANVSFAHMSAKPAEICFCTLCLCLCVRAYISCALSTS